MTVGDAWGEEWNMEYDDESDVTDGRELTADDGTLEDGHRRYGELEAIMARINDPVDDVSSDPHATPVPSWVTLPVDGERKLVFDAWRFCGVEDLCDGTRLVHVDGSRMPTSATLQEVLAAVEHARGWS